MFLQVYPILCHVGAMAAPGCKELDKGKPVLDGMIKCAVVQLEVLVIGLDYLSFHWGFLLSFCGLFILNLLYFWDDLLPSLLRTKLLFNKACHAE